MHHCVPRSVLRILSRKRIYFSEYILSGTGLKVDCEIHVFGVLDLGLLCQLVSVGGETIFAKSKLLTAGAIGASVGRTIGAAAFVLEVLCSGLGPLVVPCSAAPRWDGSKCVLGDRGLSGGLLSRRRRRGSILACPGDL